MPRKVDEGKKQKFLELMRSGQGSVLSNSKEAHLSYPTARKFWAAESAVQTATESEAMPAGKGAANRAKLVTISPKSEVSISDFIAALDTFRKLSPKDRERLKSLL